MEEMTDDMMIEGMVVVVAVVEIGTTTGRVAVEGIRRLLGGREARSSGLEPR